MDNQESYLTDKSIERRYYQQQSDSQNEGQTNEESESNLRPLKMYDQDEDQFNGQNEEEEQEQQQHFEDCQSEAQQDNSFNDRYNSDLESSNHDYEEYNDRDLENQSYLNMICSTTTKGVESSEVIAQPESRISKEQQDTFLKDVIRESEELQSQLRMLDKYYHNQSDEQPNDTDYRLQYQINQNTPQKAKGEQQHKVHSARKTIKEKETPSNYKSNKDDRSLKKDNSKKSLIAEKKDIKSDKKMKYLHKNQTEMQKKQIFNSEQQSSLPSQNHYLENQISYTEPFSISCQQQDQHSSKRKKSAHIKTKEEDNKGRSRNSSKSKITEDKQNNKGSEDKQKNKASEDKQKNKVNETKQKTKTMQCKQKLKVNEDKQKCKTNEDKQKTKGNEDKQKCKTNEDRQKSNSHTNDKQNNNNNNNMNEKCRKSKPSSKHRKDCGQKKESEQEHIEQSDQKQQLSMNPLLMISDFDDNYKNNNNSFDQSNAYMVQQYIIKNDINQSYTVPIATASNNISNHFISANDNDYPTISNISTNHQFFHNEYLQDQVPNFDNLSEQFDEQDYQQDNYQSHDDNNNYQSDVDNSYQEDQDEEEEIEESVSNQYSSHYEDTDEENIYQVEDTEVDRDINDTKQIRTQQSEINSTGTFLKKQGQQRHSTQPSFGKIDSEYSPNKFVVSYADNTRMNNYFINEQDQSQKTNNTHFTFNSSIKYPPHQNQHYNTSIQSHPNKNQLFLQSDSLSQNYFNQFHTAHQTSTGYSPHNGQFLQTKLLASSSSQRLQNADSNSLYDLSLDNENIVDKQMNIAELKQTQKVNQKKQTIKSKKMSINPQKKEIKQAIIKKKEVKKKVASQHSIKEMKEVKSSQATHRKQKETINSKTSFNPQSEKYLESEANFQSVYSNEQNIIQQQEKQLEEKDLLIYFLKVANIQKNKKEDPQSYSSASNYPQFQNAITHQLSIGKRLQETNKILIEKIKELDQLKNTQADLIDQKTESYKILKQKYQILKKTIKGKIKRNNELKKENEMIKQLKSEINPSQNIDYTQLVQALAQASQTMEQREKSQTKENISRGTFQTQINSALGDYAENRIQQQNININQKTQPSTSDIQRRKVVQNHQSIEQNNYYNQSMQNIQQSQFSNQFVNHDLNPTNPDKKIRNNTKKAVSSMTKPSKIDKIKSHK